MTYNEIHEPRNQNQKKMQKIFTSIIAIILNIPRFISKLYSLEKFELALRNGTYRKNLTYF